LETLFGAFVLNGHYSHDCCASFTVRLSLMLQHRERLIGKSHVNFETVRVVGVTSRLYSLTRQLEQSP
jgi:hypothetical protein